MFIETLSKPFNKWDKGKYKVQPKVVIMGKNEYVSVDFVIISRMKGCVVEIKVKGYQKGCRTNCCATRVIIKS